MKTYAIYTSDGKIIATVQGDTMSWSTSGPGGFIYIKAGDRMVAIVPAEGRFAVVIQE